MRKKIRSVTIAVAAAALVGSASLATPLAPASTASAEVNPPAGVDLKPVLGWSSWSFTRNSTDAQLIKSEARGMKSSGLTDVGYRYVNLDDFWYQCPGKQGPNVDKFGRWVTDPTRFPTGTNGANGIAALASYVHGLGLKFGIYVTPGISDQAVAKNTPIENSAYTADQIATTHRQENYNCGGMTGINYNKPGAQEFTNSIVKEYASWGVDYIKLDGITDQNVNDVKAWSDGIRDSGRPMQLDVTEGSYTTALGPLLNQYATQWEYSSDIEAYGTKALTDYHEVAKRFDTLGLWEPTYGGQRYNAYNDFDSVEVGNCQNPVGDKTPFASVSYPKGDGLTLDGRKTVLSLWSLASSPLILGTDLRHLCGADLALLKNAAVLAVDQDGLDASRVVNTSSEQVVAKSEKNGDVVVGLFNTTTKAAVLTTSAATIGAPSSVHGYTLRDLWTGGTTDSGSGTISVHVPAHGVALLRVTPRT